MERSSCSILEVSGYTFNREFELINLCTVDYVRGQSPRCILSGQYEKSAAQPLVALSNSAQVIAIAVGTDVQIFSGLTGVLDSTIEGIFNDNIVAIEFESLGTQLFVAGDRQVRVYQNIVGYKVGLHLAKEKLKDKKNSSATQERLESQIEEFTEILKKHQELK